MSKSDGSAPGVSGSRLGYMPALDGIRAVAMMAILTYHGDFSWAKGAFLSVDAFFVLSGFLITSLLIYEWAGTGRIDLRRFWARRARRLLPGLFLLLVGIVIYAVVSAPPDTRSALRLDELSTLLYVSNWHEILAGQSYFAQTALPSPLLHTWTLSIEEQFYMIWPLVAFAILYFRRSIKALLGVSLVAAAASAVEMAVLFHPGGDPSRVYYGTDTRAQSLLIGAALAALLTIHSQRSDMSVFHRRNLRASGVAVVAAAGLLVAWGTVGFDSTLLYRGGYLVVCSAVALVIAGVVLQPDSILARALSISPLRYVGKLSYSLYLWYWPAFLEVTHSNTGLYGPELFGARVAATFALAVVSYHFVELPIRRGALVAGWARLRSLAKRPSLSSEQRVPVMLASGMFAVVLLVAAVVVTTTPEAPALAIPSSSQLVSSGSDPSDSSEPPVVEIFGDSLALTLAVTLWHLTPPYNLDLKSAAVVGCGIATGGPVNDLGVIEQPLPICASWEQRWTKQIDTVDPNVALLLVGRWEALDRYHDGQWEHLGEPDYDKYILDQIETAVSILSARGAHVVIYTSPYFDSGEQPDGQPWPQEDPARIDTFNSLVDLVGIADSSSVTVVPFGQILSPGGHYAEYIDGVQVRSSDGVHLTAQAGPWLAPQLLPQLALLGTANQVQRMQSTTTTIPATTEPGTTDPGTTSPVTLPGGG